ncbi:MAG: helix-turn-helix transcriptional regulator [Firmicutes bacterium]|nr:helix-turn-helix transcriptional regulator [Bacillota bacterium]
MNRIKELRKKHKVTAKQLAEAVGTSRSNISMIENGFRKADIDLAKRIAKYFGLTIEEVFFVDECHETKHPRASGE